MLDNTLKDGKGITITFDASSAVALDLDPTSITPPALDGGDGIDTTTLSNDEYRTKEPGALIDIPSGSMTVAYDPMAYDATGDIPALINTNGLITYTFPNDDTVAFYGFLKSFTPGELVEGEMPTAEIEIVITNVDDAGDETAPVWTTG